MDEILLRNRLQTPLVTGTPGLSRQTPAQSAQAEQSSFKSVLGEQLAQSRGIEFSKHAVSRIEERGIPISSESLERLEEGIALAEQKGLDDTLILIDTTAFVVSAKNRTIITALSGGDLAGNVFTNITGTVII